MNDSNQAQTQEDSEVAVLDNNQSEETDITGITTIAKIAVNDPKERNVSQNEVKNLKRDDVKRHEIFSIDPRIIIVDEAKNNNRINYGTDEQNKELEDSILGMNGLITPLDVYATKVEGGEVKFYLAGGGGHRRMRAIHNIIKREPTALERVIVNLVEKNEEKSLVRELGSNLGLGYTELEKATVLYKLSNLGNDSKDIAKVAHLSVQRVEQLLKFMGSASHKVKEAVAEGAIPITLAEQLVKSTPDIKQQNEKLAAGKEIASKRAEENAQKEQEKADKRAARAQKKADKEAKELPTGELFENKPSEAKADEPTADDIAKTEVPKAAVPKIKAADLAPKDSIGVIKRVSTGFEVRMANVLEFIDTQRQQFPDETDTIFYDRVNSLVKKIKEGKTNIELYKTCFSL